MAMPIDGYWFGGGWFHGFATAGAASSFSVAGFPAVGFAAGGLAAVHHLDAEEPTSVIETAEHDSAKSDVGKAIGLSMPSPADATINRF